MDEKALIRQACLLHAIYIDLYVYVYAYVCVWAIFTYDYMQFKCNHISKDGG